MTDWRDEVLREASGGPRARRIADRLPAWRNPSPLTKRTAGQRKKRKHKRKMAKASRKRNRRR